MDMELVRRVRDRKLSEIADLAHRALGDPEDADRCIDLIVALADDIDACGIIEETGGEAVIELDPVDSPEYRRSLSPDALADEEAFDAIRTAPQEQDDGDAVSALKGELRLCRERIDILSRQLDSARGETASVEEMLEEVRKEVSALDRRNAELRSEIAGLRAQASARPMGGNAPDALEGIQRTASGGEGAYLSDSALGSLRGARDMKSAKIAQLADLAASGGIDREAADGIAEFLKVDVAVCDAILGIDFRSHDSVVAGFRKVVGILKDSEEPRFQEVYGNLLTPDESVTEFGYMQVLNSVQGMMMYLKDEIGM